MHLPVLIVIAFAVGEAYSAHNIQELKSQNKSLQDAERNSLYTAKSDNEHHVNRYTGYGLRTGKQINYKQLTAKIISEIQKMSRPLHIIKDQITYTTSQHNETFTPIPTHHLNETHQLNEQSHKNNTLSLRGLDSLTKLFNKCRGQRRRKYCRLPPGVPPPRFRVAVSEPAEIKHNDGTITKNPYYVPPQGSGQPSKNGPSPPKNNGQQSRGRVQRPSTGRGQKPSTSRDKQPSTGRGRKPSTSRDKQPSTGRGQQPSTGRGQQPSTGRGQQPSTGRGRKPSTGRGQQPSTGRYQKPSTSRDQQPSTGRGQQPSIGRDQRASGGIRIGEASQVKKSDGKSINTNSKLPVQDSDESSSSSSSPSWDRGQSSTNQPSGNRRVRFQEPPRDKKSDGKSMHTRLTSPPPPEYDNYPSSSSSSYYSPLLDDDYSSSSSHSSPPPPKQPRQLLRGPVRPSWRT
ncbi:hypothetical protein QQS21_012020 [Conoideocrella luteorostrata]|uniref:Uncharacterized protein n=1 Tax=Conoideocrella luteorostrata TaxID=1105319 RepID=A0AAJ0FST7_9HYPO|nr:hypothetical protein QQS21_012020 [Conoideocrella luteorostrata]